MMYKFRIRLCMLMTVVAFKYTSGDIPAFLRLDTTGCEALLGGSYWQALDALWRQDSIADSGFWNLKKGVAHFNTGDFENAFYCFSFSGKKDSLLSAVSYEYIGDIFSVQKRAREAVEAYFHAQKESLQPDHYQAIRSKITTLLSASPMLIDTLPFLKAWRLDTITTVKEKAEDRFKAFDSLGFSTDRAYIDSILALYTDSVYANEAAILLSRLESLTIPDSLLLTKRMFKISQIALQAKAPKSAFAWLSKASVRLDFMSVVPARALLYHQAFVEYGCSDYAAAIDLFKQYKNKYGPLPDLLIAMARAYRRLDQGVKSLRVYEQFARLYPKDPKIINILWYLAWENDQKEKYQKAISLYRKIVEMKKKPARAPDALLRIGLCYYKAHRYVKAYSTFTRLIMLYPDARCALAAQYWKSHCLLSRNETDNARNQFIEIVRTAPTDYYAYRAIESLALMGDTCAVFSFDTVRDYRYARQWLDSISLASKESLSPFDSCIFELSKKLAFTGCSRHARFYLEPLEMRYPANLPFQFELGIIYNTINDPVLSSRTGRRLIWRIPNKYREGTPLQVYALSYPFAFLEIIKSYAAYNNVDPFLVLGIIRQESVFNPVAVSRAGALGLMQLMPATARTIAADLSEPFNVDSLTKCETNIRYGVHYLKKLLDQFYGGIVQAIAGYNGGPTALLRWFELNKKKTFDLFIEDIGYDETREYVKKVLANYWTYIILSRLLNIS